MGRFQEAMQGIGRRLAGDQIATLEESARQYEGSLELLQERLAELELSLDDNGWQRLSGGGNQEFTRTYLREINRQARLYWLKNPLIRRAVAIQTVYVFGQGVNISAADAAVNEVIQAFLDDRKNKAELTSHQARMQKETELQLFSNLFFTFFVNKSTGRTRVRTISPDEIDEVISNPEDAKEPWYYKRVWTRRKLDLLSGTHTTESVTTYYPDWRYRPTGGHPHTIGGHQVEQDVPVYHVAVNKLSDMRFGVSEVYAAMDWAKAYKDFLSDWATIVRSYARFAWNYKTKGGQKGVQNVATKLRSTLGTEQSLTPNPTTGQYPKAGGVAVTQEGGGTFEPVKTAGATTKAEDGRRLLLMVSAGMGIFEHYFGDPSTGNLATATSMERPMELMFLDRQALWREIYLEILGFVVEQSVRAPSGKLQGTIVAQDGEELVELVDGIDGHIAVEFPPILQKDIGQRIDAIIKAGTLDGKSLAGTIDLITITRMLLVALEVDDVDEILEQLFPGGKVPEELAQPEATDPAADPAADPGAEDAAVNTAESKLDRLLGRAIEEFTEALAVVAPDEP